MAAYPPKLSRSRWSRSREDRTPLTRPFDFERPRTTKSSSARQHVDVRSLRLILHVSGKSCAMGKELCDGKPSGCVQSSKTPADR